MPKGGGGPPVSDCMRRCLRVSDGVGKVDGNVERNRGAAAVEWGHSTRWEER